MNKKNQFLFNFLQNQKKFLLLDKNLDSSLIGVDLSECINFSPVIDKGCTLDENTIPNIVQLIYESFCGFLGNTTDSKFENTKIRMYIYTLVKTSVFDILFVYQIQTKKIRTKRKTWIKEYSRFKQFGKIESHLCCIKTFIPIEKQDIQLDKKSLEERNKKLDSICCFPGTIIDTKIECFGYLLNSDDPKVKECFLETQLIFDLNPFEIVSTKKIELMLAVNSYRPPDFPTCSELYTDVNLENLTSFIKDCLITCYRSQDGLIRQRAPFEHEHCSHQVLYLTIEPFY